MDSLRNEAANEDKTGNWDGYCNKAIQTANGQEKYEQSNICSYVWSDLKWWPGFTCCPRFSLPSSPSSSISVWCVACCFPPQLCVKTVCDVYDIQISQVFVMVRLKFTVLFASCRPDCVQMLTWIFPLPTSKGLIYLSQPTQQYWHCRNFYCKCFA